MVNNDRFIKTPGGAKLGERTTINGKPGMHYKSGKKQEDLTPEQIAECITGKKVLKIIYHTPEVVVGV